MKKRRKNKWVAKVHYLFSISSYSVVLIEKHFLQQIFLFHTSQSFNNLLPCPCLSYQLLFSSLSFIFIYGREGNWKVKKKNEKDRVYKEMMMMKNVEEIFLLTSFGKLEWYKYLWWWYVMWTAVDDSFYFKTIFFTVDVINHVTVTFSLAIFFYCFCSP